MTAAADRHLDPEGCFNVRDPGVCSTPSSRRAARRRTARRGALAEPDIEAHLRAGGLSGEDVAALRARLLGS